MLRSVLLFAIMVVMIPNTLRAAPGPEKVIIDTDFGTTNDDGLTVIMAAQLHAQGVIELLGITVVAGNEWLDQEVAEALRTVERLGIAERVGVYAGARYPLVHDYRNFEQEKALWGVGGSWYRHPEPAPGDLVAPPDGFATAARVQPQHAVTYIVDTVKRYPREVTLLAIGPLTNIALAIRMNPEIVPLIRRIVYMAGAFDVRGNSTPAAEMNVWYDPEAARIVARAGIPQAFIPLDVTNTVTLDKALFDRISANQESTTARLLKQSHLARALERDPAATTYIYDTLALAYVIDPTYASVVEDMYVDVDVTWGPAYGRTLGYAEQPPAGMLRRATVVKRFDSARFYRLFEDLLTRPTPVVVPSASLVP
jgi:inosine-uridine nucleoside N-ribohydrolase